MIKVENLTKSFGPKIAVNGINFSLERGEVLGFLGPNGAGKSTTMRMITGFLTPSSGKVTVGGFDTVDQAIHAKRLIGYLPENAPAYTDMTVIGFLRFAAELRGLRGEEKRKAIHRVAELCFLEGVLYQSIDTLSKGYRHRTCFAQSLIHDPDVLVLDEPTDGLDPNQKHEARALIRRMGERKAIIFSTHILEEVDSVCSRAIIIDRGQIYANGTPEELRRKSDMAGAVSVRILEASAPQVKQKLSELAGIRKATILDDQGAGVLARVTPQEDLQQNGSLAGKVYELVHKEGWKLEELHTEQGRLDEVFRNLTVSDTKQSTLR